MANKNAWTRTENSLLQTLGNPAKIQDYLNRVEYDPEPGTSSPRSVIREKKANCLEGALFAAACLLLHGRKPIVMDLRAINDDDHVIALFKYQDCWGAVAKSNFTTLSFREPVYRSLRELAMSYFEFYFNSLGEKTLREYSMPLDLTRFDCGWLTAEGNLDFIGDCLDNARHYRLLSKKAEKQLQKADKILLEAGLIGTKKEGLYNPR